ncbi:MAG: RHS repeat-associated core domain-containing protein, partial [Desulfobacterales bacterium]|nr:RHS repeat-associated core domain-containing protein [Desulfobacterales bacterium]
WYDAVNRKIGSEDAEGGTTVFDYDANGNLIGRTDPVGSTTLYTYDANNRRTSERRVLADSSEAETVTQYDELGRIETVTDRTGTGTEFQYDNVLNLKRRVTMALGTVDEVATDFGYDANGRMVAKAEAYGISDEAVTQYQYDDADNLTAITNANNETVTYTYDLMGRRLREYDADGTYLRAEYDAAGNMTRVVKRDGTQIDNAFDDLNRKTAVTVNSTLAQTFSFDALSRMIQAVDLNEGRATNTAAWEYDSLNRVTAEVQNGLRVEKGYDANGNLEVLAYPSFKVVERTFNADNTLYQVWDGIGSIATHQYNPHGIPAQVSLGNSLFLSLARDAEDKETGRGYTLSAATVYSMATVWDFRDNVAQETENRGGSDIVKDFAYDSLDRITSETVGAQQSVWQYDDVGNWVSTNQNGTAETRTVNADNEYNFITGLNPAYDANGNLVSDGTHNYVYDWANRLNEVWIGGQKIAEYTYDATNRRVSKSVTASAETVTFVYNDGQVIEEYLNGSLARTYTYGAYIDDPLMVEYGGQRYFCLKDRRYSVTALTDAAGAIVERYEYSAYGRMTIYDAAGQDITASGSTIGNPYGFTGRRFDAETGLWYYRNRMYSPVLGRFLQRDPAGYVDGLNLYAYTINNPLSYLDPDGLAVRWVSDNIVEPAVGFLSDTIQGNLDTDQLSQNLDWYLGEKDTSDGFREFPSFNTGPLGPSNDDLSVMNSGIGTAISEGTSGAIYAFEESVPAWEMAGLISLGAHTGTAIKTVAIAGGISLAAEVGPVAYTAGMTTAGTPHGQNFMINASDFIASYAVPGPPISSNPWAYAGTVVDVIRNPNKYFYFGK